MCVVCLRKWNVFQLEIKGLIYSKAPDFSSGAHMPRKHLRLYRSFKLFWMPNNLRMGLPVCFLYGRDTENFPRSRSTFPIIVNMPHLQKILGSEYILSSFHRWRFLDTEICYLPPNHKADKNGHIIQTWAACLQKLCLQSFVKNICSYLLARQ